MVNHPFERDINPGSVLGRSGATNGVSPVGAAPGQPSIRFGACPDGRGPWFGDSSHIESEARGRTEMDTITMLILAIAMLLTMNVVASTPPTNRRSKG